MDLRKLKTLIDLVSESGIAELEVTEGDGRVRIVRAFAQQPSSAAAPVLTSMVVAAGSASAPVVAAALTAPTPPAGEPLPPAAPGHVVKSPMVGTFYRSAQPGSEAFVAVGSRVSEGDTLCVIEAMKLMNEIDTECAGTVRAVLVENGSPVEYGQPLFVIEP